MAQGTPHRDTLPPPPQRATTPRKSARCGAPAGSPRPHQPRPGNTGRGTLAACPKGRAAGGGTAPDTRRPSQRWKANPPGTAFNQPRGTQPPTGHASQRDSAGPPRPHTCAHSTWVADPNSPPRGRAAGGGRAPELRRSSQRRKAPPHPYDFSSRFPPKFTRMHFETRYIKLYTVVLFFLCFLKFLTKLCCRWSWSRRSTVNNCRVREFQIPDRRAQ